jgi:Uma2 family endonuclease
MAPTSTATPPAEVQPTIPPRLYRLSVEQYDELARLGVLGKSDRVELIEGLLVEKMTKNHRHVITTLLIHRAFDRALPEGWFVATEIPVVLARSEPEPDVVIVRGCIEDIFGRKPLPADVALVVEVSDSSYAEDRDRCGYYAESLLPIYWIANIRDGRIEVYSGPQGRVYQTRIDYGCDDLVPLVLDGTEVARLAVRDLLSPP